MSEESSVFNMKRVECPRCGATWLDNQLYWSTGAKADEKDLSNLVCGLRDFDDCINPIHKKGHIYGEADSWEKRAKVSAKIDRELDDAKRTTD